MILENKFTKQNTVFLKGIALLLLLFHHLFYQHPEFGRFKLYGDSIVHEIALVSKVCVAIFLILSGYGLNESVKNKNIGLKEFYITRIAKLYINYWVIWVLFVPVGVIFFNRSLENVYVKDIYSRLLLNILGLHMFQNFYGYNPTWWFISLILLFYLIFPFIRILVEKYGFIILTISFLISSFMQVQFKMMNLIIYLNFAIPWIFPFCLGIYLSEKNGIVRIKNKMNKYKITKFMIYLLLILLLAYGKLYGFAGLPQFNYEGVLAITIIQVGYEYIERIKYVEKFITFLGKHSMNIFMFHTFIYGIYFQSFIYKFKHFYVIYLITLIICILISVMIEKLKLIIRINKIYQLLEYNSLDKGSSL